MQPKKIAFFVRDLMDAKKAEKPIILDVSKQTTIAHYFVIAHGNSSPHVRAVANHIIENCKRQKIRIWVSEGVESSEWIILDLGSVIVHVFYRDLREFYALERLWGDSRKIKK